MCRSPLAWLIVLAFTHTNVLADDPAAPAEEPSAPAEVSTAPADESAADESSEDAEPDPFAVPADATAEELQAFIKTLGRGPRVRFKSRDEAIEYFRKSSTATITAAEQMLEVAEEDDQIKLAIEAKAASLFVLAQTGDPDAASTAQEFLKQMSAHENPAIAAVAKQVSIKQSLRTAGRMSEEEREILFQDLHALLESSEYSLETVTLAANLANVMSDSPNEADRKNSIQLIQKLLPKMIESENSKISRMAPKLEGVMRRTRLPGNFMEVEGTLLSGEPLDWDGYRGKVVLVDFWATWCGPCIAELPNVKKNYEDYHEKGFDVVGISLDRSPEEVAAFLEAREIPWITMFSSDPDASSWDHPMAVKYGVRGIPRAILVDQQGKVVHMNARGKSLSEQLQLLLGDPVAGAGDDAEADESAQAALNP